MSNTTAPNAIKPEVLQKTLEAPATSSRTGDYLQPSVMKFKPVVMQLQPAVMQTTGEAPTTSTANSIQPTVMQETQDVPAASSKGGGIGGRADSGLEDE